MKAPSTSPSARLQVDESRLAEFGHRLAGAGVERHQPATLDARIESRLPRAVTGPIRHTAPADLPGASNRHISLPVSGAIAKTVLAAGEIHHAAGDDRCDLEIVAPVSKDQA